MKYVNGKLFAFWLLICLFYCCFFSLFISITGKKKPEITFMFQEEIEDFLSKRIQDAPEEFISELAEYLIKQVQKHIFFLFDDINSMSY